MATQAIPRSNGHFALAWLLVGAALTIAAPLRSDLFGWSAAYWLLAAPAIVLATLNWRAPLPIRRRARVACVPYA